MFKEGLSRSKTYQQNEGLLDAIWLAYLEGYDMRKYYLVIISILASLCIAACNSSNEVMNAEFTSMDGCLAGIKKSSGQSLKIITDKPGKISGKLSNGEHFTCQTKQSGTKGIYVHGWYTVK